MNINNFPMKNLNLTELSNRLKNEDIKYASKSKIFQTVYWIMIPVYGILIIRHFFDNGPISDIIGSFCFLISMFIYALIFKSYYKEYSNVDYSLPTLIMLKKAAYRYKPFQVKIIWLLFALLLMDVGLSLKSSFDFELLWVQVYFLGAIALAMTIGIFYWKARYKPLRDSILYLIHEIERDNLS
jgi:hypothetical protein